MNKDYNPDIQRLFLEMMLEDAGTYVRVQNIYNAENFDRSLREAARFIKTHSDDYKMLPTREQIRAATGVELRKVPDLQEGHYDWFLQEFESFSRKQELERAILRAADMIEKGDFDPVEKLIKDAVQISLTKDLGMDFWEDPNGMITRYFDSGGQVSTGWPQLDKLLYGGFSRGELNIFAGGSGSGKSLVMMNIALNWVQQGLHGVYVTLELSQELTGLRTAAMLTNMSTKDIRRDKDTATLKIKMVGKKSGTYQVKALPAQSNINDIRAFLKEYQIQTGRKIDFIMIDYLDLLMPVSAKVSPNDLFVKDKYVSEELRNLAKELGILMVTASQLNRSAVDEIEFSHAHISGGISKINTADNVFGILTSRRMKEQGRYQIQCLKSRSSTGVDQKIDLEYNIETMRITDPGEDAAAAGAVGYGRPGGSNAPESIMNQIKASSTTSTSSPPMIAAKPKAGFDIESKVQANVDSSRLKQMLANLKNKAE
jgi:KaiC/GvpD/RAD55 family RecA-like ATPase